MTPETLEPLDWSIRLAVYRFIIAQDRAPSAAEIASALGIDALDLVDAFWTPDA